MAEIGECLLYCKPPGCTVKYCGKGEVISTGKHHSVNPVSISLSNDGDQVAIETENVFVLY